MAMQQLRMEGGRLTIDEGVDDELPVLLDQVVDVSKNSAIVVLSARWLLRCSECGAVKLTTWRECEKMV